MKSKITGIAALGAMFATVGFASAADVKITWNNQLRNSTGSFFSVTVKHVPGLGLPDTKTEDRTTRLTFGNTMNMTVNSTACASIELNASCTVPVTRGGSMTNASVPLHATVSCAGPTTATITPGATSLAAIQIKGLRIY